MALAAILLAPDARRATAASETTSAHIFSFTSIDGSPMPLSQWRGKALLVVNTASFCGFTQQYKGLQALQDAYEDKGLVVIGVPSNDFGGQEPGSAEQIKEFCEGAFGITFPLTDKVAVKGEGAHPFYAFALDALGEDNAPRWNFHKYLVAPDGRIAASFPSGVTPQSPEIVSAIETVLAKAKSE